MPGAQACRDLGGAESGLRRWMRQRGDAPAGAVPGPGQMRFERAEVAAPRTGAARLEAERDSPGRAAAFFAREPT